MFYLIDFYIFIFPEERLPRLHYFSRITSTTPFSPSNELTIRRSRMLRDLNNHFIVVSSRYLLLIEVPIVLESGKQTY